MARPLINKNQVIEDFLSDFIVRHNAIPKIMSIFVRKITNWRQGNIRISPVKRPECTSRYRKE